MVKFKYSGMTIINTTEVQDEIKKVEQDHT